MGSNIGHLTWRLIYTYTADSSAKQLATPQQCKGNPLFRYHGNSGCTNAPPISYSWLVQQVFASEILLQSLISNEAWCSVTMALPLQAYKALGRRWNLFKVNLTHSWAYTVQVPKETPRRRRQQSLSLSSNSPHIMEHADPLQCSQQPNTCTYPEPDQSTDPISFTSPLHGAETFLIS